MSSESTQKALAEFVITKAYAQEAHTFVAAQKNYNQDIFRRLDLINEKLVFLDQAFTDDWDKLVTRIAHIERRLDALDNLQ